MKKRKAKKGSRTTHKTPKYGKPAKYKYKSGEV